MDIVWITLGTSVALVVIYILLAHAVLYHVYTRPSRMNATNCPDDYGLEYKNLDIETNGTIYPGWLIQPKTGTTKDKNNLVIIPHGYSAERSDILPRCAATAEAGYMVYTFDWRGHGSHPENLCCGGVKEIDDYLGIIDYFLANETIDEIALYGYSMAASLSIIVAARRKQIKLVVADSPFDSLENAMKDIFRRFPLGSSILIHLIKLRFKWECGKRIETVNAVEAAPEISPRPLLILTGTDDRIVHHRLTMAVFNAARNPKRLKVQPGGGHFDNASPYLLQDVIIPFIKANMAS